MIEKNEKSLSEIPQSIKFDKKEYNRKYNLKNKEKIAKQHMENYLQNREDRLKQAKEYRESHKTEIEQYRKIHKTEKSQYEKAHRDKTRKYRKDHSVEINKHAREYYCTLKSDAISHYSRGTMSCASCGFSDIRALEVDHVDNGGTEERNEFGGGARFYRWLKKNNYPTPEKYRILCANCNWDREIQRRRHGSSETAKYNHDVKIQVFVHYSQGVPKCSRCGNDNLDHLTIDHKEGGGHRHMVGIGGGGDRLYRLIRRQDYPPDYQVLCRNCQSIKRLENQECSDSKLDTPKAYSIGTQVRVYNGKQCASKFKGVYKAKYGWQAQVLMSGKMVSLGYFKTPELAKQRIEEVGRGEWNG